MKPWSILALVVTCGGACVAAEPAKWIAPPGWAVTKGGDGGAEIAVTTLAASGPGSLAEAILTKGPRTIVFKVGGVIDLAGKSLKISDPALTIAGETAPSPGITLIKGGLKICANDVIVRHLRVRPGEAEKAKDSGWNVDAIDTYGIENIIVDHCSVSWATDENLSASGPPAQGATPEEWRNHASRKITFSHCIIGEALKGATHAKGIHSMGSLIHDNSNGILIYGNLYISNQDRNPRFKKGVRGAIVNNLIHNPGSCSLSFGIGDDDPKDPKTQRAIIALAGNVLRQGPDTRASAPFARLHGLVDAWISDNLLLDKKGAPIEAKIDTKDPNADVVVADRSITWPKELEAKPASETAAWVLENSGARPWDRDAVDRRLVAEANSGGGKIIDSENDVGGYDVLFAK